MATSERLLAPLLMRARPRGGRPRHRLLSQGWLYSDPTQVRVGPRDVVRRICGRSSRPISRAATASFISPSSRTIRSASCVRRSRRRSITAPPSASRRLAKAGRRALDSSTPRRAACMARAGHDMLTEESPTESADHLRAVQGPRRVGHRRAGGRPLFAGVPAKCHGLWCVAAHAVRHRAEQPGGSRTHHRPDHA